MIEAPSSKVTAGTVLGLLIAAILYGANLADIEVLMLDSENFPAEFIAVAVAMITAYMRRERRPSSSAREAANGN